MPVSDLALPTSYSNYLPASAYTAADVLAKLKTVDGSGSGLDADVLDGRITVVEFPTFMFGEGGVNDEYLLLWPSASNGPYGAIGSIHSSRGGAASGNDGETQRILAHTAYGSNRAFLYDSIGLGAASYFTEIVTLTYAGTSYLALKARTSGGSAVNGQFFVGWVIGTHANMWKRVRTSTDSLTNIITVRVVTTEWNSITDGPGSGLEADLWSGAQISNLTSAPPTLSAGQSTVRYTTYQPTGFPAGSSSGYFLARYSCIYAGTTTLELIGVNGDVWTKYWNGSAWSSTWECVGNQTRRVYPFKTITGSTGTYYKLANLPASTGSSYDLIEIRVVGGQWTGIEDDYTVQLCRRGPTYRCYVDASANYGLAVYIDANGDVWLKCLRDYMRYEIEVTYFGVVVLYDLPIGTPGTTAWSTEAGTYRYARWNAAIDGNGGQPPAPKPRNAAGAGNALFQTGSSGGTLTTPAGGSWLILFTHNVKDSDGTIGFKGPLSSTCVVAGGTVYTAGQTGYTPVGVIWRIAE